VPLRIPVGTQEPVRTILDQAALTDRRVLYRRLTGPGNHLVTLPQGESRALLYAIHLDILPSADVADRYPRIQFNKVGTGTSGHAQAWTLIGTTPATASLSAFWSWGLGFDHLTRSDAAVGTIETLSLPDKMYIDQGDNFTVYISNGAATDNLWLKVYYEVDKQ